jgi:hypothetical protein
MKTSKFRFSISSCYFELLREQLEIQREFQGRKTFTIKFEESTGRRCNLPFLEVYTHYIFCGKLFSIQGTSPFLR